MIAEWFTTHPVAPGVHLTAEPAVHDFFRANLYTVTGRDRDLQVDFGVGVAPLAAALPLSGRPVLAVATHAHVDHVGGFHEFAARAGHAAEAASFAAMDEPGTLQSWFGQERAGPSLARLPSPSFRLADWALIPAPLTETLAEGGVIDLGDRRFAVLHLPGHSPGSIGLLDEAAGLLIAGDAIYQGGLVDDIPGADIGAYCATMERLRHLDCALVLGGHGDPMTRPQMQAIAEGYLRARG
ncbi:MAG: MBL fold metallo-hydrolase [Rhodobacteraceae bacterium]|nr:MBL fold metallo-hydrolase [Paracoccaceae bacterium]